MLHALAVLAIAGVVLGLPLLIIEGVIRDRRADKRDPHP